MHGNTVGMRELKAHLSRYVRSLRSTGALTVTDRGRPIARLVPIEREAADLIEDLVAAGLANWDGQSLARLAPVAHRQDDRLISDLLLEDRG